MFRSSGLLKNVCLIVSIAFACNSCGIGSNQNGKTSNLVAETEIANVPNADLSITVRKAGIALTKTSSKAARASVEDIDRVTVTITGLNIPDSIIYDLVKIEDNWRGIIGDIPVGNTTIKAEAFDAEDRLIYENQADVQIENDVTKNLNLALEPTEAPEEVTVNSPEIQRINLSTDKINPEGKIQVEVFAVDPNNEPLTYLWEPNDIGQFNNTSIRNPVWDAPAIEGTYQLVVTVRNNDNLTDTHSVTIEVDDDYGTGNVNIGVGINEYPNPPLLSATPTRIDQGELTQLSVSTIDPEGDPLSYIWTAACGGFFNDDTLENPQFTAANDAAYGPCELSVSISDGILTTYASINVNISDSPLQNIGPQLISRFQTDVTSAPDGVLKFSVEAEDPEGGQLIFIWFSSLGELGSPTQTNNGTKYKNEITWTAPSTMPADPYAEIFVEITDDHNISKTIEFQTVTITSN